MSSKIPKTGLAKRMRAWMKERKRPFSVAMICKGFDIPPGKERDTVSKSVRDFCRRGEIVVHADKRNRRQPVKKYRYNHARVSGLGNGIIEDKIYKAMRLLSMHEPFAATDVQRMTGLKDSNYIDKLIRKLRAAGYVRHEGYRPRSSSYGREACYRIVNTDRFRLEVMK